MGLFYATTDADGHKISQNANICAFETEEEARTYLLKGYNSADWNLDTVQFCDGDFGDCWIKVHTAPGDDERYFRPFTPEQLIIAAPGQHPGGRTWWIMPSPAVLVIERIEEMVR